MFKDYYDLKDKDYNDIWSNCLFVVDANVLLNLYRYSEATQKELLNILQKLSDKLWLPHQVALEYHSNRLAVIYEQRDVLEQITNNLNQTEKDMKNKLIELFDKNKRNHPFLDINQINKEIEEFFKKLVSDINDSKSSYPNLIEEDIILNQVTTLFDNKVGEHYSNEQLEEIYDDGKKRYSNKVPPGYKDEKDKKDKRKYYKDIVIQDMYGDLIVWKQLIDKAKNEEKPVVFVTDDNKEDWWEKVRGRTIGPRRELINEFMFETKQSILMYNTDRFMEYASKFLREDVSRTAIDEVQNLREVVSKKKDKNTSESVVFDLWKRLGNDLYDIKGNPIINIRFKDLPTTSEILSIIYKELKDSVVTLDTIKTTIHYYLLKRGLTINYSDELIDSYIDLQVNKLIEQGSINESVDGLELYEIIPF